MHIFYTPELSEPVFIMNAVESNHACKVMRLQVGDEIGMINGTGGYYIGKIVTAHHKHCEVEVTKSIQQTATNTNHIHLAVAPTKNIDRFQFFLEKATEIGVQEITPLLSKHSERKIIKMEKLQKTLIAAAKQSITPLLPKLNDLVSIDDFIEQNQITQRYIAHCEEDQDKQPLKSLYQPNKDVIILIGPEGDFTSSEIEAAKKNGFIAVSLGNTRLRTETAAIVACHTLNLLNT